MRKALKVFLTTFCFFVLAASYAHATEFSLKVGPMVKVKNNSHHLQANQLKLGLGFWGTPDKPDQGGFTSGLLLETSLMKSLYKFWFTPVFGYDIPLGTLPLTVTPNLGLGINYAKVKGAAFHEVSVNIRPGVRARYNLTSNLALFVEPAVFNFEPWRYNFGNDAKLINADGSKTGLAATYEAGAGISFIF